MKTWIHRTAALATLIAAGFAHGKGVTDNEITLGLITDLSGPIANYGKESRNGATLAVEEVNARGGVHGRKLKLLVEDHGYDPRRAMLAADKLVTQSGVFAIVGLKRLLKNMWLVSAVASIVFTLVAAGDRRRQSRGGRGDLGGCRAFHDACVLGAPFCDARESA